MKGTGAPASAVKQGSAHLLLVASAAIAVFVIQYLFRSFDDNRLTSWATVFASVNALAVFILLVVSVSAAAFVPLERISDRAKPALLFVTATAMGMLFRSEPEMIVDASRYFLQAKHLELYGVASFIREWGGQIGAWTDMPMGPFLYGLIFRYLGESRVFVQAFNTGLFACTVLLTYLTGRRLWDAEAGFRGGLLLLAVPYLYTQVPLMLVDVPTMFSVMLCLYCFLRALDEGGFWVWATSLALAASVLFKYSSLLVLAPLFFACAAAFLRARASGAVEEGSAASSVGRTRHPGKTAVARALSVAVLSLALLAFFAVVKKDALYEQVRLLVTYQGPGLGRWSESFLSTFFFQTHPFVTMAACYSVYMALRKRDASYLIVASVVVLMVLFQVRRIRYLMVALPTFSLMAAYGLRAFPVQRVANAIVSCAVASSLVVALAAYLPSFRSASYTNLRDAGAYLDGLAISRAEVYTFPSPGSEINPAVAVPLLDLYTRKEISSQDNRSPKPPAGMHETSSLRFTWEYPPPAFYRDSGGEDVRKAVVIVYGDPDFSVPPELGEVIGRYPKFREFAHSDDVYQYQTLVRIYHE